MLPFYLPFLKNILNGFAFFRNVDLLYFLSKKHLVKLVKNNYND